MESTAPRLVTTPVYDAPPPSLNGSEPKSTGFFGAIKGFFGRVFGAVKSFVRTAVNAVRPIVSRAYAAVRSLTQKVTDFLPAAVKRYGKPFLMLPTVFPQFWAGVGRAATWLYNHGPRQIQNFVNRWIWTPVQNFIESRSTSPIFRMIPVVLEFVLVGVLKKGLVKLGVPGMLAGLGLFAVLTPGLQYISDFTHDNQKGQTVMAAASAGAMGLLFVGSLGGHNWGVGKAFYYLVRWVAPLGGLYMEARTQQAIQKAQEEAADTADTSDTVEVSNEEMAERVAEDLRKDPAASVTLVQSKVNVNPKGRREVWTVKGHDVDVDSVSGFYWKDGVGYDRTGQPVAVDLRGDLTRTTRDRRRKQFTEEWVDIHPLSA